MTSARVSRAMRANKSEGRRMRLLLQRAPEEITKPLKAVFLESAQAVQFDAIRLCASNELKALLVSPRAIGVKSNGFKVEFGFRTKQMRTRGWFAHFLEFGTKPHSLARGKKDSGAAGWHPGMAAQPFMQPAADMNRRENRKRVQQAMNIAVKRMVRRGK